MDDTLRELLAGHESRVVELGDEDLEIALFLGAARELTNIGAGRDTQNAGEENARGHFLGALSEIAFLKLLEETGARGWSWAEPLRLAGGSATRGARGGDFRVEVGDRIAASSVEVKSLYAGKADFNLNIRKVVSAASVGLTWQPIALCTALAHAALLPAIVPLEALASAAKPVARRRPDDWEWHEARYHPDEFGQSYLSIDPRALAASEGTSWPDDCSAPRGDLWLGRAPRAVERLRSTDPQRWPETGVRELTEVTAYSQVRAWYVACREEINPPAEEP